MPRRRCAERPAEREARELFARAVAGDVEAAIRIIELVDGPVEPREREPVQIVLDGGDDEED
jgi:hypothetical protein